MSDPTDDRSFPKKFALPIAGFVGLAAVLGYLAVDEGWFAPAYTPPPPQAAAPPVPSLPQAPPLPPLPAFAQAAAPAVVVPPVAADVAQPVPNGTATAQGAPSDTGAAGIAPAPEAPKVVPPVVDRSPPSSGAADDDIRRRQAQNAQLTLEAARLGQEAAIEETRLRIARARNEIEKLKAPPAPPSTPLPILPSMPANPVAGSPREMPDAPPRLHVLALRAGPDGVRRATVAADGGRYDVAQGGVLPGGWTVETIGARSITIARNGGRGVAARRVTIDLGAPPASEASASQPPAPVGALPVLPIAPGFVGGRP